MGKALREEVPSVRPTFTKITATSEHVARWVLVALFAAMLVAALMQVTSRELGLGLTGAEEVARYCMVAATFLAIPLLTRLRGQIAVDALAHFLPSDKARLWLARIILVCEGLFLLAFGNYSYLYAMELAKTDQSSIALDISTWIPAMAMPIGALLGLIVTAFMLVGTFRPGAEADPYGIGSHQNREEEL